MKTLKTVLAATLITCSSITTASASDALAGALFGGLFGSKLTNDSPAGAVIGAIIGSNLAQKNREKINRETIGTQQNYDTRMTMRQSDEYFIDKYGTQAVKTGHRTQWFNEFTGSRGEIRILDTYRTGALTCRIFESHTIRNYDQNSYGKGTACRPSAGGSWSIIN